MTHDRPPRVLVTGLGCITPLGADVSSTWRRLLAGAEAQAPITAFDVSGCHCKQGAQVALPEFPDIHPRKLRRWSRATRLAVPAFREALAHAGLLDANGRSRHSRLTLSISTTGGAMELAEAFARNLLGKRRRPNQFFNVGRYQAHQQVLNLQDHFGFRGPVTIIANACASGANAIGHGADLIRAGLSEMVIAGGYEPLTELIYVGFDCLLTMSKDKCRPFDQRRSGLMLGEAAAFLVLESEPHARSRGATVLGEVAGYGHGTDTHHLTQPDPRGTILATVMRQALTQARCQAADVGYLNAHGTATALNDASECAAFTDVFDGGCETLRISSTKAAIGHTLGAAGAVEALFALQALRTGELPPHLNVRSPEPAVARQLVAAGERAPSMRAAMSVNLGFGGSNAALVFTRYEAGPATNSGGTCLRAPEPARTTQHMRFTEALLQPSLGICSTGTVFPDPEPQRVASVAGHEHMVLRVDLKRESLARWQNEPRVRRASPITIFMLEAAKQALDKGGTVDRARLGIVAALHTGMIASTRRFYEGVVKNGQRFASPNLFPETVFNSAASHVASVLGVTGPCYTVLGDDSAWVNGIGVAAGWLANGLVDHALVIGAEEFDPMELDAYEQARWLRQNEWFMPSEGAGAVLLRRARDEDSVRVAALAEGFTYRNASEARIAAAELFESFAEVREACRTAEHKWLADIEAEVLRRHGLAAPSRETYRGEAFAATAAWDTAQGVERVRAGGQTLLVPVWGQSEQCSALLLAGPSIT